MAQKAAVVKVLVAYTFLVALEFVSTTDYSLLPGHLQPLGSKQQQWPVETVNEYPEASEFFANYVDKSKPLLIKGAAKKSPAFHLWTDEYLASHPESETARVFIESRKKENRTKGGKDIPFKEFIAKYKTDDIYMVNGVPTHIQKDVLLPAPLRCEETKKHHVDTVLWFSSGGTKSVLHNDDVDNINCLFKGRKQLMFIEYPKYIDQVLIDRPVGGYSDVDVDKVDFTKYKGLAEVEFINATMEEGDCLFIPFKWFHQVNSYNNEDKQNVAVNVWFTHLRGHRPKMCDIPAETATLDKFIFSDLVKQKQDQEDPDGEDESDDRMEEQTPWMQFEDVLANLNSKRMDLGKFVKVYQRDILNKKVIGKYGESGDKKLKEAIRKVFNILNVKEDGLIDSSDFDEIRNNPEVTDSMLENQMARIEDIIADLKELKSVESDSAANTRDEL